MIMKANDLFENYLKTICRSKAQFEAVNKLHKLYFESQLGNEVEIESDCERDCDGCDCDREKGVLNESVDDGDVDIGEEAEKNGLTVPEYRTALEMFAN